MGGFFLEVDRNVDHAWDSVRGILCVGFCARDSVREYGFCASVKTTVRYQRAREQFQALDRRVQLRVLAWMYTSAE